MLCGVVRKASKQAFSLLRGCIIYMRFLFPNMQDMARDVANI